MTPSISDGTAKGEMIVASLSGVITSRDERFPWHNNCWYFGASIRKEVEPTQCWPQLIIGGFDCRHPNRAHAAKVYTAQQQVFADLDPDTLSVGHG